jgi:hypothetical protein
MTGPFRTFFGESLSARLHRVGLPECVEPFPNGGEVALFSGVDGQLGEIIPGDIDRVHTIHHLPA